MHRIAATPGGWNAEQEGVIFIEQNPAPIVFLSAADTDIQSLATCLPFLPIISLQYAQQIFYNYNNS